jgi:hypothetical protein
MLLHLSQKLDRLQMISEHLVLLVPLQDVVEIDETQYSFHMLYQSVCVTAVFCVAAATLKGIGCFVHMHGCDDYKDRADLSITT